MKNQYVILTGSKNNAGDFLIKDRALELFSWLRSDREIIDMDGWKPLDSEALSVVNNSKALVLMGGPALQEKMRPRVYPLADDLNKIKVPILTMGIGWHSPSGNWWDTHRYSLNEQTLDLLKRVESSGYLSSVRDYHTLNVLRYYGFSRYLMTGCPALYDRNHIGGSMGPKHTIGKVGFSLGVSLKSSASMFRQMQDVLLRLRDGLAPAKIVVAFHHSLDTGESGSSRTLHSAQQLFKKWLDSIGVESKDISGSAISLKSFYSSCDFHIGYRVHAHVFMCSISKPSVLINEDGRGKALGNVLGGVNFDGYSNVSNNKIKKILSKIGFRMDAFKAINCLDEDIASVIDYEVSHGVRLEIPRQNIDRHFKVMKEFIEHLP